jgi:hypothetical protein
MNHFTIAQLGREMFFQVQNPTGVPVFTGQDFEACKRFAEQNQEE